MNGAETPGIRGRESVSRRQDECFHRDGKEGRKQSQRNSWVVTSVHPGNMGEVTYEELVEGEAGRVMMEQSWI